MVLRTWPPANRIPFYVAPELLPFLAERRLVNNLPPESPLSWTGVEDEPLEIESDEGENNFNNYDCMDKGKEMGSDVNEGKWKSAHTINNEESSSLPLANEPLQERNASIGLDEDDTTEVEEVPSSTSPSPFLAPSHSNTTRLNNSKTKPLFCFRNYGNKNLAAGVKRLYYKCTTKGCKATYQSTFPSTEKNASSSSIVYLEEHNHDPPSNPRVRPEVKEKALSQMGAGATPSNVHAEFVRNASLPLSSADVPSLAQLKMWKHEFSMKDMPTGDVLENIIHKHKTFVRKCKIFPTVHIAMVSEFGANLLTKSEYAIVDGTFNTTECKLVLTTLLGFHEGIAIPCAYLLSNSKETDNYEAFYKTAKKATKGVMSPKGVLLDFEEALAEGFVKVFPDAAVLTDFFHFVQANVKTIQKLSFKSRSKDVVKGVQSMWYASTKKAFDAAVGEFLALWDEDIPAYATYFRRNWLDRYHPEKWASYARADDAPSGSGSAEGFHNRLNHNMPRNAMSLDKMVDYLAAEDEYWRRLVNDSRLWTEKKASHASSQDRHRRKRRMLSSYVERSNNEERSDAVISSDLLSSDGDNEQVEDDDSSSTHSSSLTITSTTSSSNKPQRQRKPRKPNLNTPMHERCLKCRLYKFNDQCSLTMCKACCIASPSQCKYTHHRQAKLGARQPFVQSQPLAATPPSPVTPLPVSDIKERLEKVIQAKGEAFISYDRGTNSKGSRRIKPQSFSQGKEGELVHAYCYVTKDKRSFYLHHITRMEDHDWEKMNSQPLELPVAQVKSVSTPATSVEDWLNKIGLARYWPSFQDNGYDIMDALIGLDEATLDLLGVTMPGHRAFLLRKAKDVTY